MDPQTFFSKPVGQLTISKEIADNPAAYAPDQIAKAFAYLSKTRANGGVRNSERASKKLERRLFALNDEFRRKTGEHLD